MKRVADRTFSPKLIAERRVYSNIVRNIPKENLLLDEIGLNLHTSRNYGYSPINTPFLLTVPANRSINDNFLSIIIENKIIHVNSMHGSFNSVKFISFLGDVRLKIS